MLKSIYFFKIFIYLHIFLLSFSVFSQPLDILIQKILKKDESINSSKIAVDKANNDLSSVTSLFTPKIDLSIPVGNEKLINNNAINTNYDYYEFSAKISQNIYDFGNTSSKYKSAKNKVELAEISKNNVTSNKIFEAIVAYLSYIKAYEVLEYAKKSEGRIKQVTNLENEKVARGAGLASNVLQSKARLAGAKATRVRFEGDLSLAINRFYNVFREMPSDIITFKRPPLPLNYLPSNESEAIKLSKKNNISLNLSKINLKNSENTIKGSKSKFFPSIKAIAELKNKRNMSGLEGTEIDQTYKIEMKYPISIGGPYGLFYKERADYKSSMNQYMIAKYGYDRLERNLEEAIRNAWQTKKVAKENFEFLTNQANISGEFFDLAMKEVKLGNRQLIDILSSETAFINAKSAAATAKTQYELSIYQLLLSMGILDENIFFSKNSKNKVDKKKEIKKSEIKNKSRNIKEKKLKSFKKQNIIQTKIEEKKVKLADVEKIRRIENKKATNIINTNIIIDKAEKDILNKKLNSEKKDNTVKEKIKINQEKISNDKEKSLNDFSEKEILINNNFIKELKEFKIQLGAFSKLRNAELFLKSLNSRSFNEILLVLENDMNKKIFRVKSLNSFSEKNAQQLCKTYISNSYNCILSKI